MKSKRILYVFLAIALLLIAVFLTRPAWQGEGTSSPNISGNGDATSPNKSIAANAQGSTAAATPSTPAVAAGNSEESTTPAPKPNTSSSRRPIPTEKKPVKDILASWDAQPPWPEGPRLMVDVESADTRYVNLRPNEQGIMPRLNVGASETLQVKLSMPDSPPGETIFLELPNGGTFLDQELKGMTLAIGDKRTIDFSMNASALRGHCTIYIRQAGHTRTLPLWVGEPTAPQREDPADPNVPAA